MPPHFESMHPDRLQELLRAGDPRAWRWLEKNVIASAVKAFATRAHDRGRQYEVDQLVSLAVSRVYDALTAWQGGNLLGYLHNAAKNACRQHHAIQHAELARCTVPLGGTREDADELPDIADPCSNEPSEPDSAILGWLHDIASVHGAGFVSASELAAFVESFDPTSLQVDTGTFVQVLREAEPLSEADSEKRVNAVCARVVLGALANQDLAAVMKLVGDAARTRRADDQDTDEVLAYLAFSADQRAALLGASKSSGVSKRWGDPIRRVTAILPFVAEDALHNASTLADSEGRLAAVDAVRLGFVEVRGDLERELVELVTGAISGEKLLAAWIERTRRKGDRVLRALHSRLLLRDLASAARWLARCRPSPIVREAAAVLEPYEMPSSVSNRICARCGIETRNPHDGARCLVERIWSTPSALSHGASEDILGRPGAKSGARHLFSRLLVASNRVRDGGVERAARAMQATIYHLTHLYDEDLLRAAVSVAGDPVRRCC